MKSRKFGALPNVALILWLSAAVEMGCASDTEEVVDREAQSDTEDAPASEGQLAPGYSHPQGFRFGH